MSVKKCDIYIHLDTIPAFDGQTDGIAKTRLATANRPRVNILVANLVTTVTVLFRAGDVVDPVTISRLIMQNLVTLSHTLCAHVDGPKEL